MSMIKNLAFITVSTLLLAATPAGFAGDKVGQPKPDKLATCPVSGDKLGEMGKPYVFTYKDREVKLCCKSCRKDFDKDPAKYLKLIEAADKAVPAKDAKN
jgi:hypothetical protein